MSLVPGWLSREEIGSGDCQRLRFCFRSLSLDGVFNEADDVMQLGKGRGCLSPAFCLTDFTSTSTLQSWEFL